MTDAFCCPPKNTPKDPFTPIPKGSTHGMFYVMNAIPQLPNSLPSGERPKMTPFDIVDVGEDYDLEEDFNWDSWEEEDMFDWDNEDDYDIVRNEAEL